MYTYYSLKEDVGSLVHSNARVFSIGESALGRQIFNVRVGSDEGVQIIISGGIHAREHVSSMLVAKQLFHALKFACDIQKIGGINFIPMLNPDGNLLCFEGLISVPKQRRQFLKDINGGSEDFSLWKANANAVDLNVNFDANWGTGVQNVKEPSKANYIGTHPFSESESRAVADFTRRIGAASTVSYHAAGRELYWQFGQEGEALKRDKVLADYLNEPLKYKVLGDDGTSAGGYKDYCIQCLKIPAFTIELVDGDKNPHPILDYECAKEDIKRNLDLPMRLLLGII